MDILGWGAVLIGPELLVLIIGSLVKKPSKVLYVVPVLCFLVATLSGLLLVGETINPSPSGAAIVGVFYIVGFIWGLIHAIITTKVCEYVNK